MDRAPPHNPPAPSRASGRKTWEASSLGWLYLDLNSYFASVEQQLQPRLRGRPVAVVPVMTDTTCAIAASYEAKAFGIKTGTPIWEAKQKCPDIALVPARHDVYVDFHHRILDEVDRHIPVEKVWSIDEMACRLMGPQRLEAEAVVLAQRIKQGLLDNLGECIRCSIGIAPNAYLAKVASDMQKPDGLVVLRAEDLPGPLFKLKLRDLPGIGANMETRLRQAGIDTIETLWNLSARDARRIWGGVAGEDFLARLHGRQLQEVAQGRRSISHSHVLPPDLRSLGAAELVVRRLAAKAGSRVRRMGFFARQVDVSVRFENGERWADTFRLTETQDNFVILDGVSRLWRRLRQEERGRRLKKVGIVLHDLIAETETTLDLFGGGSGFERDISVAQTRAKLSGVLDQLNAKFGRDTVAIGQLPAEREGFMGAKIAFNRIPERAEFKE
ncbi:hypothetical protein [uncultured Ferrovibrio sp.]|jgi:Nucleotidyltransferase/DNA polymerase involved in DNA repair|uniref:Y-family DNA polymerase n=1 Tax=uncultured Ferrovibrio sp. TaxID=1576913 RepID=UPI002613192D|nr:hypothetical protein [uncultured Ferrovibrio sp.]